MWKEKLYDDFEDEVEDAEKYADRHIITKMTTYAHHMVTKCSANVIPSPPHRLFPRS